MSDDQGSNYQNTAILKELSDIKESLAVNTTETANIKLNINDIKTDMKDIKNAFVTRIEFVGAIKELKEQISPLKKIIYGMIGIIGTGVVVAVLKLVLKQ